MGDENGDGEIIEVNDGFQGLNGGRCRVVLEGRPYTLRAPAVGELRDFRRRLSDMNSEALADNARRSADGLGVDLEADYDRVLALMVWVFETLSDKPLPADRLDELPAWVAGATITTTLLRHWQATPFLSGSLELATAPATSP